MATKKPTAVLVATVSLSALACGVSLLVPAAPARDRSAAGTPTSDEVSGQAAASPTPGAHGSGPGHASPQRSGASGGHGLDSLMGTVLGPGGLPVANAQVSFVAGPGADEPPPDILATSNDEGGFLAQAPSGPGDYVVRIQPSCHGNLAARLVQLRSGHPVLVVLSPGGSIEGRCRDAAGLPVAGSIMARGHDWFAQQDLDHQGRFRLSAVPPGRVTLTATPKQSPAMAQSTSISVSAGATTHVRMTLPLGHTLTGHVADASGAAVPRAQVRLSHSESSLDDPLVTETSADGHFRLAGLAPGEARLVVVSDAQSAGPFVIEIPPGEDPAAVTLRLSPHRHVQIYCSDSQGRPLGGVLCRARSPSAVAVSDRWGQATLGPLPAGDHGVSASVAGAITVTTVVSVQTGSGRNASGSTLVHPPSPGDPAGLPVELVLSAAAELHGRVILPTGEPAAEAVVEIHDGQPAPHRRRCDDAGRFSCRGVTPGLVRVVARAPATGLATATTLATTDAPVEVQLKLPAPGWLSGQVTDGRGVGLSGASVRVMAPWGELLAYGDADGRFALGGLGTGPVDVEARAPGHGPTLRESVELNSDVGLVLVRERRISGRVSLPSGEPVARFVVTVARPGMPSTSVVFEAGHFELLLSEATTTLTFLGEGLVPATCHILPSTRTLELTMEAGDAVTGLVVDDRGAPLPGVAVLRGTAREENLLSETSFARVLSMSDANGRFHVQGVTESGLTVTLSHPDFAPRQVSLVSGPEATHQMSPGGRLRGGVARADGTPLSGVGVVVEGPIIRRATTDAHGVFAINGLAGGTYRVTALHPEVSDTVEVEVSAAKTTWVNVR